MRIDLVTIGDHLPDPHTGRYNETQAERYDMMVDMAVKAEQGGFGAFWAGEHHANAYIIPSPQILLTAIAMRTRRIRLGTAVTLLPNSDPVRVAEDFAMLDLLSHGRAEIGFGSGITLHTFQLFGQNADEIGEISTEYLDLLEQIWDNDIVNWSGKYRPPIKNTRIEPRPFGGGRLPVLRSCGSEERARDIARRGYKLGLSTVVGKFSDSKPLVDVYRQAWQEAGRDPAASRVSANAFIHVQRDGRKAREFWQPYRDNYFAFGQRLGMEKEINPTLVKRYLSLNIDPTARKQAEMCGEPAEVAEMLLEAYEDVGRCEEIMVLFDIGGLPATEVLKSMDLFIGEVMPRLGAITRPEGEAA